MAERIRIKARFADQCPLFKQGEGMTLELPGVVHSRCHNVCAASLQAFLTLYDSRKGKVDGREYSCTWTNCRATMTVDVGAEFPELRGSAPAAAPAPAPGTPTEKPATALLSRLSSSNPAAKLLAAAMPKEEKEALDVAPKAEAPAPAAPPPVPGAAAPPADKTRTRIMAIAMKLKLDPMFRGLPPEELERIASAVKLVQYPAGTVLLKAGDAGEKYYLIAGGNVEVTQVDKDGTEKVLSKLGQGQGVGEMSLLTGEKCSATVKTLDAVQCLLILRADFEHMLEAAPQLNRHFNKILAERLRTTNAKLTDVIEDGVLGKLSMFSLAELSQALAVSGRTGYLHLQHKNQRGYLTVRDGFCFNVKLPGKEKPEDAFLEMMQWREGEFRFEKSDVSTLGLRPIDLTGLLMEGMRRADEQAKAASANATPAT